MVDKNSSDQRKILSVGFNQDQDCVACGTQSGFKIFRSFPLKDTFERDFGAGIRLVSMLFHSNILCLVGDGANPKYPRNKVAIWDDDQSKCVGELGFKTEVRAVRMRKDTLVVVLDTRTYVYNFFGLKLMDIIDTVPNPSGICAVSSKGAVFVVTPGQKRGAVRVINYDDNLCIDKQAHKSDLVAVALSPDARMFATASRKGMMIRVFATATGELLKELRRGTYKAEIQSLAFSSGSRWLACSSNKGTVHVFSLAGVRVPLLPDEEEDKQGSPSRASVGSCADTTISSINESSSSLYELGEGLKCQGERRKEPRNKSSVLSFMRGVFSYFGSEWSFAKFKVAEKDAVVGFGPEENNRIIGKINVHNRRSYLEERETLRSGVRPG